MSDLETRLRAAKLRTPYWAAPEDDLPFDDFNKETVEPGTNETFPDGATGIRADDDFWQVAALPYEYRALDTATIVSILWPGIKDPVIRPDAEDKAAWKAIFDSYKRKRAVREREEMLELTDERLNAVVKRLTDLGWDFGDEEATNSMRDHLRAALEPLRKEWEEEAQVAVDAADAARRDERD